MSGPAGWPRGFSLVELMIALVASGILILGIVHLAQAAGSSFRLQQNLGAIQENARFALQTIGLEAEQAGYRHQPWQADSEIAALSASAADNVSPKGDLVAFQRWSRRNCFANDNPVTDERGLPRFYLRVSGFSVSASGSLAHSCRYGPDGASLVTQINRLGLIEHVESLQALYAEDTDGDGNAERWVRAGDWADEAGILGIRIGLVLAGPDRLGVEMPIHTMVLDEVVSLPPDGHVRRIYTASMTIRGRSG